MAHYLNSGLMKETYYSTLTCLHFHDDLFDEQHCGWAVPGSVMVTVIKQNFQINHGVSNA